MYKRIIAAVNEYSNSETAARYALALAGACGAKLSLVFALETGTPHDAMRRAESALERLFLEAGAAGVEAESVMEKGPPLERIIETASDRGADVVFAGSRREEPARRFFERSLPRELLVRLPCAIAVVRAVQMHRAAPRHILFALGGRAPGIEERAYFTAKLAQGFGARVTLVHLPEPVTSFFYGQVRLTPAEREALVPKDVRDSSEVLAGLGVPHERMLAHGSVAKAITAEAVMRRGDLIIVGASARGALRSLVKGDPVEEIMRETPCNLIVFRPAHGHPAPQG